MAMLETMDHVLYALDRKNTTTRVFSDASNAIYTVNNKILLSELYHYEIRGLAYAWFKNYLSNRLHMLELEVFALVCYS